MRSRALLIAALTVILAGDAFLLFSLQRAEERARKAELRAQEAERRSAARGVFLTDDDIRLLKRSGLTDPVSQLRSDLEGHSTLLPMKGVMGGTMKFYDRDGVVLLPGRYVYAPAEDGHYLVHAILKYDLETGGKIRWRLVDASRD
jgi:hypothetical protein